MKCAGTYKKNVYYSIDIYKFVASLMVVAIHTHPFDGTELDYYFTSFCRIAVPFFFISSSFFFFCKSTLNICAYTKRMLTLYGLWLIIESPFVLYKFFVDSDNSLISNHYCPRKSINNSLKRPSALRF